MTQWMLTTHCMIINHSTWTCKTLQSLMKRTQGTLRSFQVHPRLFRQIQRVVQGEPILSIHLPTRLATCIVAATLSLEYGSNWQLSFIAADQYRLSNSRSRSELWEIYVVIQSSYPLVLSGTHKLYTSHIQRNDPSHSSIVIQLNASKAFSVTLSLSTT